MKDNNDMKDSVAERPYTKGFETGYFEGLSAENPYVQNTESFRFFESGQAAGSRAWNKKYGDIPRKKA